MQLQDIRAAGVTAAQRVVVLLLHASGHRSMEATKSRAAALAASALRLGAVAATLQLPQPDPSSGAPTAMMAGVTRRSTMDAVVPLFTNNRSDVTFMFSVGSSRDEAFGLEEVVAADVALRKVTARCKRRHTAQGNSRIAMAWVQQRRQAGVAGRHCRLGRQLGARNLCQALRHTAAHAWQFTMSLDPDDSVCRLQLAAG